MGRERKRRDTYNGQVQDEIEKTRGTIWKLTLKATQSPYYVE